MSTKKRTQSNISQFFVKKPNNSENVPPYNEPNSSKRQKLSNSLVEKEKDSIDRSRPPNDLLRLEYKFLGPGWVEALQKDLNSPTFKKVRLFYASLLELYFIFDASSTVERILEIRRESRLYHISPKLADRFFYICHMLMGIHLLCRGTHL